MKFKAVSLFILFVLFTPFAYAQNVYKYTIDLKNVVDDRVKVSLETPVLAEDQAVFVMPRVIPGSYAYKEYGRYVTGIKAIDAEGNEIKLKRKKNVFYIKKNASKVRNIEYWVDDTWDDSTTKNFIFQPGGSNIEAGKNYMINHFAFEGYFEGYKNLPFEVTVLKPSDFAGLSWLKTERLKQDQDVIFANSYDELADNPVMYCRADTVSFIIDSTRIFVSSYSSDRESHADSIAHWLKPLAVSLRDFMGKLPVSEYYFTFYFATPDQVPDIKTAGLSGYGALEHNHGSVYFLPEMGNGEAARYMVQDIAAHEFLHILTPLNLRSKEIADFNFKDRNMSQHLWLYEGVTEYFSWLVRVQSGLVSEEEFFDEFRQKLINADSYGLFSFTEMSKNVLEPEWQEKYSDVYQKGAVMAMILDQQLLVQSGGKYGLKHLISDLMAKYGQEKPFVDDALFSDIKELSFPEVEDFLLDYIAGAEPLPLTKSMASFGIDYTPSTLLDVYYSGNFYLFLNVDEAMEIKEVQENPAGLMPGDKITHINGNKISRKNFREMLDRYFRYNTEHSTLNFSIIRDGQQITVEGKTIKGQRVKAHIIEKDEYLSKEEKMLYGAWINGNYVK